MGRLDGKVAVITGATSGIGLRTAEIFVAEGAKVVIAGRRAPEGEALAKKLGANCIFRQTDVTVEEQMRALIGLSVEKFGRIDCLFNNAGGPAQTGGIEGLEVARFDAAMATLVRSVMLGMKHAAPHMRSQGSGSIINNGSIAGRLAGYSASLVYGAAKAAVIHLTKCVAMELGEVRHPRQLDLAGRDRHRHFRQGAGPVGRGGGEDARTDARGLQIGAADSARRAAGRYRPRRGVPRQRRIQLHQRPRSGDRRRHHRRPQLDRSSSRAMSRCARRSEQGDGVVEPVKSSLRAKRSNPAVVNARKIWIASSLRSSQ